MELLSALIRSDNYDTKAFLNIKETCLGIRYLSKSFFNALYIFFMTNARHNTSKKEFYSNNGLTAFSL